jgi:hypothetical protein
LINTTNTTSSNKTNATLPSSNQTNTASQKNETNTTIPLKNDTNTSIPINETVINNTNSNTTTPVKNTTSSTNTTNTTTVINTTVITTCDDPNMIWDSKENGCVCKQGYHYYHIYQSCKPECQVGYYLNTLSMSCEPISYTTTCGANMFLNSNNECQCYQGYILKEGGSDCRFDCTAGFKYNIVLDSCEPIPVPTCPDGYTYNSATQLCDKNVIKCPEGAFLNEETQQCVKCPDGYTYNLSSKLCEAPITSICPPGYDYNPTNNLC